MKLYKIMCALIAVMVVLMMPAAAFAQDTQTIALVNKPGIVLMQTVWTADATIYEFDFEQGFEADIENAIAGMVKRKEIPNDEYVIYQTIVRLMIENMEYYIVRTGNVATQTMSTAAVGTGFIVTPDGYLVTNAHVVETNKEQLYMQFAQTTLSDIAAQGTEDYVASMRRDGYEMSQEEQEAMYMAFIRMLAQNMEISNLQTGYSCYMGNVTPGSDVSAKGIRLDLRKVGESIPGKDIAILKLDKTNLPTVTLGDDSKLRTGDKVYAMGYPAVATLADALNVAQAIQEPTMTSGIISARKEMAGGWNILQTDAAIHGGNSGGPLFNEAGEVIGINTFGMIDQSSGAMVAGMNFAVPISIAKQFLNEINVTSSESAFTAKFKEANTLFQSQKYREALEILRGLNETNPGYPVVADLLAQSSELASSQPASEPAKSAVVDSANKDENGKATLNTSADKNGTAFPWLWVGIGGGLLVLIAVVVIVLSSANKKKAVANMQTNASVSSNVAAASITATQSKPNQAYIICPHCGAQVAQGKKFCADCGKQVESKCASCGATLAPGAKFCPDCGEKNL